MEKKILLSPFRRSESRLVRLGCVPSGGSSKDAFPCLFQGQESVRPPWFVAPHLSDLCVCHPSPTSHVPLQGPLRLHRAHPDHPRPRPLLRVLRHSCKVSFSESSNIFPASRNWGVDIFGGSYSVSHAAVSSNPAPATYIVCVTFGK